MPNTNTKQIISAYIKTGGAMMNEHNYQLYKFAMLFDWLEEKEYYTIKERIVCGVKLSPIETTILVLFCKQVDCNYTTEEMDDALSHLETHISSLFKRG